MSTKYNRFLITTCIPAMAVAVFSSHVAYAGFEWNPPEKTETVEMIDAPAIEDVTGVESAELPVVEDVVIDVEDLQDHDAPIEMHVTETPDEDEIDESVLPDTPQEEGYETLEDMQDIAQDITDGKAEAEIVEKAVKTDNPVVDDVVVTDIVVLEENTQNQPVSLQAEGLKTNTGVQIVEDVEKVPAQVNDNRLDINPFPVENTDDLAPVDESSVVVLTDESLDEHPVVADEDSAKPSTQEEIFWNKPPSFDVIEGFGSDMPLALTLRQIVPARYAYAFGKGVNPGVFASWEGGLPWNEVLANTLDPLNYGFKIDGNTLSIHVKDVVPDDIQAEDNQDHTLSVESENDAGRDDSVLDDVIAMESNSEAVQPAEESKVLDKEPEAEDRSGEIETSLIETVEEQDTHNDQRHVQDEAVSQPVEIIEIMPEQVVNEEPETVEDVMDQDVIDTKKDSDEDVGSTPSVKRGAILDPGQTENTQPEAKMLSDEKKNLNDFDHESGSLDLNTPSQDVVDGVDGITEEVAKKTIDLSEDSESVVEDVFLTEDLGEDSMSPAENSDIDSFPDRSDIAQDISSTPQPLEIQALPSDKTDHGLDYIADADVPDVLVEEAPPASPSNEIKTWEGKKGHSLRRVLEKWSAEENIELVWNANDDIDLSSTTFINGTFENAIDVLMSKSVRDAPSYEITLSPYQLIIR